MPALARSLSRFAQWMLVAGAALALVAARPALVASLSAGTWSTLAMAGAALTAATAGLGPAVLAILMALAGAAALDGVTLADPATLDRSLVAFAVLALPVAAVLSQLRRGSTPASAYASFVGRTPVLCWLKDAEGRYLFVNEAVQTSYGRPASEWHGQRSEDMFAESTARRAREADKRALEEGEWRGRIVDERGRAYRTVRFPVPLSDGATGVGAMAIEVTQELSREEALRAALALSERRAAVLQSVMDHVPEGIAAAHGTPPVIDLVSRRGLEMVEGRKEDLLIDLSVAPWRFYTPDHRRLLTATELPLARACRGETVTNEEFLVETEGGHPVPILCDAGPVRDAEGRVTGGVVAWRDISERKRTERELVEAHRQLEVLISNTPLTVVVWGRDGRVTKWAGQAESTFGYAAEEVIGRSMRELHLVHPDDRPLMQDLVDRLKAGERFLVSRMRCVTKSEKTLSCYWYTSTVLGADGLPLAVLSLGLDVTEQVRAEEELRAQDRDKNRFLAMLAHELRNPLAPLRNAAFLLRQEPDEGTRRFVGDLVERQVGQMGRLLDDLLDMSRLTLNKLQLKRELVPLQQVLDAACEQTREALLAAGQTLHRDVGARPYHVYADATRLTQVFANLLDNAAKYSQGPGEVRLTVEADDRFVTVTVEDQGIGIEQGELERVFEMFARIDDAKPGTGGLGIGLALVRRLVEMHGGRVSAMSAGRGQGSTFFVTLPLVPSPSSWQPDHAPRAGDRSLSVLVVDDVRDNAQSLAMLLGQFGFRIDVAYTGAQALESASRSLPDVALLDIGLPDMSGHVLGLRLREMAGRKPLELVAMTGWGQDEDVRRSRELGFQHHLTKPVEIQTLLDVLDGVARSRS